MSLFTSNSRPVRQLTLDIFVGVCIFFLIFVASVVFLSNNLPHHHQWIRVSIENQDKMSDPDRPEIHIYGGSSVSFGFNFEYLNEIADRPVLNYGLHAGLGLDTLIRRIEANAGKGDAIILQLEGPYYTRKVPTHVEQEINLGFTNRHYGLLKLSSILSAVQTSYPIYWSSIKEKIKVLRYGKKEVPEKCGTNPLSVRLKKVKGLKNQNLGPYCELSYNILGYYKRKGRVTTFKITEEVEKKLVDLQNKLKARGAIVLFTPPPALDRNQKSLGKIIKQRTRFYKKLSRANFVSFCTEVQSYKQDLFSDTALHLNHVGSFIRSLNFAKCLEEKNWVENNRSNDQSAFIKFLKTRSELKRRYDWEEAILSLNLIKSQLTSTNNVEEIFPKYNVQWTSLEKLNPNAFMQSLGQTIDTSRLKYKFDGTSYVFAYEGLEQLDLVKEVLPDFTWHCKNESCDSAQVKVL